MLSVQGAQLEAGLGGGLFVFAAGPFEVLEVGGGDGEEAGVFEFGVAGDEFLFPLDNLALSGGGL